MPAAMPQLMSTAIAKTFIDGVKSLWHLNSLFVAALAAGFSYLANRSLPDLGGVAFGASITILVFLLPAAGIVGPYLLAETKDALAIIAKESPTPQTNDPAVAATSQADNARAIVKESLGTIVAAAKPLQRGFSYTTLAVILAAFSVVLGKQVVGGVRLDQVLAATCMALLVGTAATVFPMTWRLLQLEQVEKIYELLS